MGYSVQLPHHLDAPRIVRHHSEQAGSLVWEELHFVIQSQSDLKLPEKSAYLKYSTSIQSTWAQPLLFFVITKQVKTPEKPRLARCNNNPEKNVWPVVDNSAHF